jgi:hypothetical protein
MRATSLATGTIYWRWCLDAAEADVKHFIATYDVEISPGEPHERFREAALNAGWRDTLSSAAGSERLPSNTLIGEFSDLDQAHQSFDAAIAAACRVMSPAKLSIERRFIVERLPAGRLKATKTEWVKTNVARLNKFLKRKTRSG